MLHSPSVCLVSEMTLTRMSVAFDNVIGTTFFVRKCKNNDYHFTFNPKTVSIFCKSILMTPVDDLEMCENLIYYLIYVTRKINLTVLFKEYF